MRRPKLETLIHGRWAPTMAALACGLAAGLVHPPFGFLPGLLAYGVIMRLGDAAPGGRSAFLRGWVAGVGYFAVSVWWVTEAFLVEAETFGWMAPFALILLSGGLAVFWGLALLAYRTAAPGGPWRVFVFAGALSLLEWARGTVFTGFPWNLPGESWAAGTPPSQAAAFVGAYGLTWITVLLGSVAGLVLDPVPRRDRLAAAAAGLLGLSGLYGAGAWWLAHAASEPAPALRVRIVQANIDQKKKWRPENLNQIFADYVGLTTRRTAQAPDVVIWPEGALPAVINDLIAPGSPYAADLLAAMRPGQTLMMGANRAEPSTLGEVRYFNSLIAFRREDAGLRVSAIYDKHRLVPFGEYVPLGDFATVIGLRSLAHMPEDFSAGPTPAPIHPAGLPAAQPLICYEALFPRLASRSWGGGSGRPTWIINVSNDAWFGATSGPWQHLNLTSYRAIEEGLPIVRATPTGVSAVIDGHGRIIKGARLGLGESGVIDAWLPNRLHATPYSRVGDRLFACMLLVSSLILGAIRWRRSDSNS